MTNATAERLNAAVYKHRLMWTDLSARVMSNEGCPKELADEMVARLIEKKSCPFPVAIALIDLIVELKQ